MRFIQEIKQFVGFILKLALSTAAALFFCAAAPVILILLPQTLLVVYPQADFTGLALFFLATTPIAVSLWMAFVSVFYRNAPWRQGREALQQWRKDKGGFWKTNFRAAGWMLLGGCGSFVCEILLLVVFKYIPVHGTERFDLWFRIFPIAAFAPVILLVLVRSRRAAKLLRDNKEWDNYLAGLRSRAAEERALAEAPRPSEDDTLSAIDKHIARLQRQDNSAG